MKFTISLECYAKIKRVSFYYSKEIYKLKKYAEETLYFSQFLFLIKNQIKKK